MPDELEPCPICGRVVHNDTITLACTGRYSVDDSDEVDCPYFLDVGADTPELQSVRNVRIAGVHNALARRAEIGRLVEEIVEAKAGLLTIGRTPKADGVTIYSAWSSKPFTDEWSLLDALRALHKEIA